MWSLIGWVSRWKVRHVSELTQMPMSCWVACFVGGASYYSRLYMTGIQSEKAVGSPEIIALWWVDRKCERISGTTYRVRYSTSKWQLYSLSTPRAPRLKSRCECGEEDVRSAEPVWAFHFFGPRSWRASTSMQGGHFSWASSSEIYYVLCHNARRLQQTS